MADQITISAPEFSEVTVTHSSTSVDIVALPQILSVTVVDDSV